MTAPGIERVLAEVLAGHPLQERWTCRCGSLAWERGVDGHDSVARSGAKHRAHVATEQAKALAAWAQRDEGIAAAMDGVYEVEGRLPDPSVRQYAVAVLTAIFGGAS